MKYLHFTVYICLTVFCTLFINSCKKNSNPQSSGGGDTITYFWLAAIKDANVRSDIPEYNGSGGFSLVVAHGKPNGEQRSYIKFFIPQLPAGSKVLEAYINVYEDSRQQPGNGQINIGTAQAEWDPDTITWKNQPNPVGPLSVGAHIGAFISENMWRTSGNITLLVQDQLDDPSTDHGWILDNSSQYDFTRSFTSMNAPSGRTQSDLDKGPRLLMKVQSTVPLNNSNIGTTITDSNELGTMYGFGVDILVYKISSGGNWPDSWEVATR